MLTNLNCWMWLTDEWIHIGDISVDWDNVTDGLFCRIYNCCTKCPFYHDGRALCRGGLVTVTGEGILRPLLRPMTAPTSQRDGNLNNWPPCLLLQGVMTRPVCWHLLLLINTEGLFTHSCLLPIQLLTEEPGQAIYFVSRVMDCGLTHSGSLSHGLQAELLAILHSWWWSLFGLQATFQMKYDSSLATEMLLVMLWAVPPVELAFDFY